MIHEVRLRRNGPVAQITVKPESGEWVYRFTPTQDWRRLLPHQYDPHLEQTLQELRGAHV